MTGIMQAEVKKVIVSRVTFQVVCVDRPINLFTTLLLCLDLIQGDAGPDGRRMIQSNS